MDGDVSMLAEQLFVKGYERVPEVPILREMSTLPTDVLQDRGFRQCVHTRLDSLWRTRSGVTDRQHFL